MILRRASGCHENRGRNGGRTRRCEPVLVRCRVLVARALRNAAKLTCSQVTGDPWKRLWRKSLRLQRMRSSPCQQWQRASRKRHRPTIDRPRSPLGAAKTRKPAIDGQRRGVRHDGNSFQESDLCRRRRHGRMPRHNLDYRHKTRNAQSFLPYVFVRLAVAIRKQNRRESAKATRLATDRGSSPVDQNWTCPETRSYVLTTAVLSQTTDSCRLIVPSSMRRRINACRRRIPFAGARVYGFQGLANH